jgi:hypothetical protein
MAMAIQKEHLGHAGINPQVSLQRYYFLLILYTKLLQAILNHMEARCWTEPGQNTRSTSGFYNRGSQLFSRVKAARATKSDKTLATFLEQLNSDIMSSCRELRNEQAAELDAGTPYGPEDIQRAATPSSTTSSSTSSEDSEKSTDTPTEIEASLPDGVVLSPVFFVQDSRSPSNIRHSTTPSSTTSSRTSSEDSEESTVTPTVIETSLQDDVVPSPGLSVPTSRPLPQPLQTKQSVYRYTTMLYEYATSAKKPEPIYKKEWVSINLWRCVAVFDGTLGVGEAQSFREAKHIASQKICQTLNTVD